MWILRLYPSFSILERMLLCAHISRMWQKIPPKSRHKRRWEEEAVSHYSLTNCIILFHKMVRLLRKVSCLSLEEPLCQSLTLPEPGLRPFCSGRLCYWNHWEDMKPSNIIFSFCEPGITLFWTGYIVNHYSYTHLLRIFTHLYIFTKQRN